MRAAPRTTCWRTPSRLEQAEHVRVELIEAQLRDADDPHHRRAVAQRHCEKRLLDLRRPRDPDADPAVGRVARQEGLSREGDVPRDPFAHAGLQHLHRRPRRGEVAPEGDRPEIVSVADEHAAVVVVDQQAELVGDRGADLGDVVQAAELRRDPVQHLQVRDRAELGPARVGGVRRALAAAFLEDDDLALATRLRGHHRHLGARDELAGVGGVLGAGRDPHRERDRPDRAELRARDLLLDPLGEPERVGERARGGDDGELLAADPADAVGGAHRGEKHLRDLGEDMVARRVAVDVVDPLEVVQVEHHEGHGGLIGGRIDELLPKPLVERPVVPEAGQRIGLRLALERGADVRVVHRKRCSVAEAHREQELVLGELLEAGAVDVQSALEPSPGDERDDDQRLGVGRGVGDEPDARVELRAVRQHRLAVLDRPARDPDAVGERLVREHLLGVVTRREDGAQLPLRLVGLVERDVVERDELADRGRDALQEVVERLLGEQLVEDVRELAVRLDERVERRVGGDADGARGRDVRARVHGPLDQDRRRTGRS